MALCMSKLLNKKGVIIIEVQYLLNTLKDLTFDNIYHEHYNYWSLTSLDNFFKQFKVKIVKAEKINTHINPWFIYNSILMKGNRWKIIVVLNEILLTK